MSRRRGLFRATAAVIAALSTVAIGAEAAQGAVGLASSSHHSSHQARELSRLLAPAKKYYGVYVSQAPSLMAPINKVTQETGKQPNLSLFYESWGSAAAAGYSNINTAAVENACNNGMLPMLTWESWNTSVNGPNGPAWSQPDFSPAKIAGGAYDAYIRASAEKIKSLDCPIALRLDQEFNSYWYPWGLNTAGMNNSPASFVAMWRHIHDIFDSVGATNVLWVWSPNVQGRKHKTLPDLSASYPGDNYVDWVGIDGYFLNKPGETFGDLFQPTINQLKTFVANKPWIIAEAGVGSGASKPKQIKSLVNAVARRRRFNGLNYFDTNKPSSGSDWAFNETPASLDAFKTAINRSAYGAGTPGVAPGR